MPNPNCVWLYSGDVTSDSTEAATHWDFGSISFVGGKGRTSTRGLSMSDARKGITTRADVYVAAALIDAPNPVLEIMDGGTTQVRFELSPTTGVTVKRGASTTIGTTGFLAAMAQPLTYHFQCYVLVHPSAGIVRVKINKVQVLELTGVNTRDSGVSQTTGVRFYFTNWDDIAIATDDWPGDLRMEVQRPASNGDLAQFTPSAGSNYQNVDEMPSNGDTDYNASATVGHIDTFNFPALTLPGTPRAVQTIHSARGDIGSAALRTVHRVAGSNYVGSTETVNTSYAGRGRHCAPVNPATGADWTASAVNATQTGYEAVTV